MTAVPDHREAGEARRASRPAYPELPLGFRLGAAGPNPGGTRSTTTCWPAVPSEFTELLRDYDTLTRTPKDSCGWYRGLNTAHLARTEEPAR